MKSPFKFLDSYTKDDREIFFGRDREIEELYQRVFESKLMLVYGVSGTGKSSLIHCGLANKFQETDWLPLVIRRGANIINSMAGAIQAANITKQDGQFTTPAHFKKAIRSLYLDHYKPVFFIFDQFEELFIFGDKEERKSFVQIIKSLVESDLQCRLIFVMREEYMAGVTEFERYITTFFANRVRIEKMSHVNALEAIKEPCKVFNISLEEGFAETLLEKLSPGETDVELTYLQVFLDKIFRSATINYPTLQGVKQEGVSFTLELLSQIGNVSDLLGNFLDEQISLLDNPDEGLAILKSFVSVKGSRRQINPEEVSEYAQTLGQPLKESVLTGILQTFINLRILRDKDENGKYELRHDALATKIYEKITLVEKEILEIRQFIDNAYNNHKKRGVYLSPDDLNYIAPYESRLFLSKELSGLIDESRKRLTRAKRRRRTILITSAIALFVVLTGFTFWALNEKRKADKAGIKQLESILKLNENFEKVKISQVKRKDEIYQLFEKSYLTHPFKLKELWDKALAIKKASDELTEFIYQLEYIMLSESENISPDSARKISLAVVKNKSNTRIPHQILVKTDENTGLSNLSLLKQKIQNYRNTVYDQIDRKDWDKINFNIETEKSVLNAEGDSALWENANFGETILASAITNLNNLITEINYIELDAITFFYSGINVGSFAFNMIEPIIIPQSTYVMIGSNYKAQLMLSAFDTRTNLEAYVFEGENSLSEADMKNTSNKVPLISDKGKIDIVLRPQKVGLQKFYGFISVKTPDGSSHQYVFASGYAVGEPAIFVAPINMNVLYLGVDNPIDISIPGVSVNSVKVGLSNGTVNRKDGHFLVKPVRMEDCIMNVTVLDKDGTSLSFAPVLFKVKDKPLPVASIKGIVEDKIKKAEPLSLKEMIVAYPSDFDFGVTFKVMGFTVAAIRDGQMVTVTSNSNMFTDEQRKLFTTLRRGDKLYIQDIYVRGSDGSTLYLKGLIYTID